MEFDLNKLYASTFGYVALPYPLGGLRLPDVKGGLQNIANALAGKDMLGRTFFMPVALDNKALPNTFINITAVKHIIKTPVTGRNGTVKEIANIEDFKIKIRGFCINYQSNDYPIDEVEKLQELFDKNISLPINNSLCELFGVNMAIVESLNLPEQQFQNVQAYEINLISDDDFDVIIK